MNKLLLLTAIMIFLLPSCTKESNLVQMEEEEIIEELRSLEEFTHSHASEILRHCIREEYGGVFHMMKLYHNMIRIEGVPCDTTFDVQLADEITDVYSIDSKLELKTDCGAGWGSYNDRKYRSNSKESSHSTRSEMFDLDMNVRDQLSIAGNSEEEKYFYGHILDRLILITKGISPEINPEGKLIMFFSSCTYDEEKVEMTSVTEGDFTLEIWSSEGPPFPRLKYTGIVKLIDDKWTITYHDEVVEEL